MNTRNPENGLMNTSTDERDNLVEIEVEALDSLTGDAVEGAVLKVEYAGGEQSIRAHTGRIVALVPRNTDIVINVSSLRHAVSIQHANVSTHQRITTILRPLRDWIIPGC